MGIFNAAFPVLPGKEQVARDFAAETIGARKADFEKLQARSNVTRESWTMQQTPMGTFMLVWFDGDVDAAFMDLATDNSEFTTWFRAQVVDFTGVDLAVAPEGPPPELVLDWNS